MKKSLIRRVIIEGRVDTKKYRYELFDYSGQVIRRTPIDQVKNPDWKNVYYLSNDDN